MMTAATLTGLPVGTGLGGEQHPVHVIGLGETRVGHGGSTRT